MSDFSQDNSIDVKGAVQQANAPKQELRNGDIVEGADGTVGIVIDDQERMSSQQSDQNKRIDGLIEMQQQQISQIQQGGQQITGVGVRPESVEKEKSNIEALQAMANDPTNPKAQDAQAHLEAIAKLEKEAANWEPSLNGIAPAGSAAAQQFNAVMEPTKDGGFDISKIDMEGLKQNAVEEYNDQRAEQGLPPVEAATENPNIVQFNVPSEEVNTFIMSMSKHDREKVTRAREINVVEVKRKKLPTSVRTIQDINEFKKVTRSKLSTETFGTVLPNSGFFAEFKGAGSLAMATLIPEREDAPVDFLKRYQFCYDNLINTSIGKLNFNQFCAFVDAEDLSLCIYAILHASEPEEANITFTCEEPTCRNDYNVKFRYGQLLDADSITEETQKQIAKIVGAKNIYQDARKVFDESPNMQVKTMDIPMPNGNVYSIELKYPNGTMYIERMEKLAQLLETEQPGLMQLAQYLLYIPRIYLTTLDEHDKEVCYEITDMETIQAILEELDEEAIIAMSEQLEKIGEKRFPAPTYSFKGEYECPKCHRRVSGVPCNPDALVFMKAIRTMM